MSRIYIPALQPDDWKRFLADEGHWRTGFSARTLAYSWQEVDSFPSEVAKVLAPAFPDVELLLALPEHKVPLPGGSRQSQNDLWVLARSQGHNISIAVEGKVSEPFGPTVADWQKEGSKGKTERLDFLLDLLGIAAPIDGGIRYQLLHRTASAIIEARRFGAPHAVMLVHSFSESGEWFDDLAAFARLLGVPSLLKDTFSSVGIRGGVSLNIAWVSGNTNYLSK
jgi:hypothetical protein